VCFRFTVYVFFYVSLDEVYLLAFIVLDLVSLLYQANRLTGKNVSDMT